MLCCMLHDIQATRIEINNTPKANCLLFLFATNTKSPACCKTLIAIAIVNLSKFRNPPFHKLRLVFG